MGKLTGKNILFLGDSLTSPASFKKYIDVVRTNTGANCFNYGVNNSTIAKVTGSSISFVDRYSSIMQLYPDFNYFDLIIIFGGVNDYANSIPIGSLSSDNTTFVGALNQLAYQLQLKYTKAKIIFMTPLISTWANSPYDYMINGVGVILERYREAMREVARLQSCIVFDTHLLSGLNPNNGMIMYTYYDMSNIDGIHPNANGHIRIALPLINVLEGLF
jgi:lysophospholipase L1-like esterase